MSSHIIVDKAEKSPQIIILIGMMGAGKSTIGEALACEVGYSFIDSDEQISKTEAKSISEIFEQHGEDYFRNLENQWCKTLNPSRPCVISTGGGLPIFYNNLSLLKQLGAVIYLKVGSEALAKRLTNDQCRPLLKSGSNQIKVILDKRRAIYQSADYTCMASRPIENIVKTIRTKLRV